MSLGEKAIGVSIVGIVIVVFLSMSEVKDPEQVEAIVVRNLGEEWVGVRKNDLVEIGNGRIFRFDGVNRKGIYLLTLENERIRKDFYVLRKIKVSVFLQDTPEFEEKAVEFILQ